MATKTIPRVFKFEKKDLTDPNPNMSPKEVQSFYANQFPELATATIKGPEYKTGKAEYVFTLSFKPKG
jgi:PRTRC genetic system protein C